MSEKIPYLGNIKIDSIDSKIFLKSIPNSERFKMVSNSDVNQILMIQEPSKEQIKVIESGLETYNRNFPGGDLDIPIPDISLVLRNPEGDIVGGVITSMLTGIMHLESLWIDEKYRGKGLGKHLVLSAEKIGKTKGYPASQTWTFSFQAPDFYKSIGYTIVGIFTGYTNGITEYVLLKKFGNEAIFISDEQQENLQGFTIAEDYSKRSMNIVNEGLHEYVKRHVGEIRKKYPGKSIDLVLETPTNQIIGGLSAYTTLKAIHIVRLWIDKNYRDQRFGKKLLETAERIAKENGCISGLVNVLSFQSPEFFMKQGYKKFGISDGYPYSNKEYFLFKHF